MVLKYIVDKNNAGKTVKEYLFKQGISHRLILTLKQNNCIYCNNSTIYTNYILSINDKLCLDLNYTEEATNIVPTKIPLNIIYEDDGLLIIFKNAGIPVHPSLHYYSSSLSSGVKEYFNKIGLKKKIRPVNRLDKDTSGLVIFAKNEYVQEELIKQMKDGSFKKEYIALVDGILDEKKRNN